MIISTKDQVRQNFSRASLYYEEFSRLQREIGLELLSKAEQRKGHLSILDVGMGTGWFTKKVENKYPYSKVVGLDFARGMVVSARRKVSCRIVQADARALPFKDDCFDMVVSNCVYQWIEDLTYAFNLIHRTLKDKGVFQFSCFGQKTLQELFLSLKETTHNGDTLGLDKIRRLPGQDFVYSSLSKNGFKNIDVSGELREVEFKDLFAIVRWLKDVGANTPRIGGFVGRQWLMRANEYYQKNFSIKNHIRATFEIIWAKAER